VGVLAVEARGVVKRYGAGVVAVDGLDLRIERGEVYGLLGPNGAGKTTAIRMLLGLVRPSAGLIKVLGLPPGTPAGLRQVGAMGESAFYPFLSGRDNLRAAARRSGVSDARVDAVLGQVALSARAGHQVGTYSFGMKQRLGVALALLKDPALLVLDEPSNGLDPVGQLDMRELIRTLSDGGRTIVLSSHDMTEVERLCSRVGIIGNGRILAEGSPDELRGQASLRVRAAPAAKAAELATAFAEVDHAELADGALTLGLTGGDPALAAAVNRQLVGAGLEVSEVRMARRSLQDVFLKLTGGRTGGADSVRRRQRTQGP
jgi:ABC-2 type transport system ATP-binding protein